MSNDNKTDTIYVEALVINMYVKFHSHPVFGSWQPIKSSDFDKFHMKDTGQPS